MKKKKRGRPSKKERQDRKLRKAIEAGARMAEVSISKIHWDIAHRNIKIVGGKLDHHVHQAFDCAADLIAKKQWFNLVLGSEFQADENLVNIKNAKRPFVVIPYRLFKDFVDKQNLKTKEFIEIFKKVPKVVLDGKTKVPGCSAPNSWEKAEFYEDNICGAVIAWESEKFEEYRSDGKLRGKGSGQEEPVCILLFSNLYGLAFVTHSMRRRGTQIQDPELYHLPPKAQELFQSVRWKNDYILLTVEAASMAMNLKWPVKHKARLYERVEFIRRILKILKDNEFINYNDETYERGKIVEKKTWGFYVRKRKLIGFERNDNRV